MDCGLTARSGAEELAAVIADLRDRIVALEETNRALAAEVVASRKGPTPPALSLVDAKAIAAQLGRSRRWVYDHRDELGAVLMSTGARPRLGFDPVHVAEVMASRRNGGEAAEPSPLPPRPRGRSEAIDLLPVKGKAA